jgi:hypothetical protein
MGSQVWTSLSNASWNEGEDLNTMTHRGWVAWALGCQILTVAASHLRQLL